MNDAALRRAGATAALIGTFVLIMAGVFGNAGSGLESPYQSSAAAVAKAYSKHEYYTVVSAALYIVGALLVVLFAAGLWCRLAGAGASSWSIVGLSGGAIFGLVLLVIGMVQLSLAGLAGVKGASPQSIQMLAVLWDNGLVVLGAASAPLLGGFSMAFLGRRMFPRWLAMGGLLGAATGLIGVLPDVLGPFSGVAAQVAGVVGGASSRILVIWLFVVGMLMNRPMEGQTPAD